MNIITKIWRPAVAAAVTSALVALPAFVFAMESTQTASTTIVVVPVQTSVDVHINANGHADIKGAAITSIGNSSIEVTTTWGGTVLNWTVNYASSTEFLYKGGRSASASVLGVGDVVNINGMLTGSGLTLNAKVIRDRSKEKVALERHIFEGRLNASISTTTLPTTFGLKIGNINYTVNVPTGTQILNRNWGVTDLTTFQVNDTVRVYGSYNTSTTSSIDVVVVRDVTR